MLRRFFGTERDVGSEGREFTEGGKMEDLRGVSRGACYTCRDGTTDDK